MRRVNVQLISDVDIFIFIPGEEHAWSLSLMMGTLLNNTAMSVPWSIYLSNVLN